MASVQELQTELNDAVGAIAELKQTAATEKEEIANKLNALDAKVTEQTGLIEQLTQGLIPDSALAELRSATASIRETTSEIRNIVESPVSERETTALVVS